LPDGDGYGGAFFNERPFAPKGVDDALTIEHARAGIVVPDAFADHNGFIAKP
jgi:hypothetical protein